MSIINLTWTDNSTNELGFYVYRAPTTGGPYTLLATLGIGVVAYSDTGLTAATSYFYVVTSYNAVGESSASTEATATTLVNGAPSDLVARATSSASINLQWVDNATTETGFLVERSFTGTAGGVWTTIATLPADTSRYDDVGLFPDNTYYYRVTAIAVVPAAVSNIAHDATYSGAWDSLGTSAVGTGLSDTVRNASSPSAAADASGRVVAVWEQNIQGINQIYLKIYDPMVLDSDMVPVGFKPVAVNIDVNSVTLDANGRIDTIEYYLKQTSGSGNGFSVAARDAQRPRVVYDATRDEFVVIWQEVRNSRYEIVGRRFRSGAANLLYNAIGGYYNVTLSDSVYAAGPTAGQTADDELTTTASTWNLSNTALVESVRPEITSFGGSIYAVWEEYIVGTRTWQVYGALSALGATADYPAIPAVPAVAVIDTVGATSNAGTGISAAVATRHARSPSIAVADATHIYVGWQSTDPVDLDGDITTNYCDGNNFAGAALIVANAGSSQNPKVGTDSNAVVPLPYITWEDNSLNNQYNVYALQGNALGTVWSNITASGITSGDTTTTGVSDSDGNAQNPSIGVNNTSVHIAWQDTTSGKSNIYVKRYVAQDTIPGEDAAWSGMGGSDEQEGISLASIGAFNPQLRVSTIGSIYVTWQDQGASVFQVFLRRW